MTWTSSSRKSVVLLLCLGLLAELMAGCRSQAPATPAAPAPAAPMLLTATGDVRALAMDGRGSLWAATGGGVLSWTREAAARRWTAADGLPDSDVRVVRPAASGVDVTTATGHCRIEWNGSVTTLPAASPGEARPVSPDGGTVTAIARTPDTLYLATALDFWRQTRGRWQRLPLPPGSPATHVSALCPNGADVIAGLYGDGLYRLSGTNWTPFPKTPSACRFAMALALTPTGLAVGTRSGGVWRQDARGWRPLPAAASLPATDIQTLAAYAGALWAGTLDGGLVQYDGTQLRRWTESDGLRADSPRGLAAFGGRLYVRYSTGETDCFDGRTWQPAFSKTDLPRAEVYALAADSQRLCVGGWAGWAVTDGRIWERHYRDPELSGQVITAIAPDPDGAVWIGTQKQGLLCCRDGRYTRYQEAQGLTDDWITCIAVRGGRVLVGTYTGGVLERRGQRFVRVMDSQQFAVRALAFGLDGQALAATPLGVYREMGSSRWQALAARRTGGLETQALLPLTDGLWVGSRTGLSFVTHPAE